MIDPEGTVANALRTLWVWLLISPGIAPLTGLLSEFAYAFGVGLPSSVGLVFGGLIAGGIVGAGERRYGRLVVASLLTAGLWIAVAGLLGLTNHAVFGSLRLVAARVFLWIAAASLALALVFYTDFGRSEDPTGSSS